MAFSSNDDDKKMFNEINITPLTDIFLVLLIIMMVVAPMFQDNNSSIKLPEVNSGLNIEQKNATVSITKDGAFFLNSKQIDSDNIAYELEKLKNTIEKKEVVVKADSQTKSNEIMKVMKAATEAGYEKLIVAGEPLTKKEQKKLQNASKKHISKALDDIQEGYYE